MANTYMKKMLTDHQRMQIKKNKNHSESPVRMTIIKKNKR